MIQPYTASPVAVAAGLRRSTVSVKLAILGKYGPAVQQAAAQNPKNWQTWWWVCLGGEAVFIPAIFLMAGRWSSRKAREDIAAHEQRISEQLAQLGGETASA